MPTSRSAAASPRSAASASHGPPQRLSARSDLRRRRTDEVRDVARADDDRVDTRTLELGDLLPRRHGQVGNRELSGRDVLEQIEHVLQRVGTLVAAPRGEQEDLGVDAVERSLEGLCVLDADDALQSALSES